MLATKKCILIFTKTPYPGFVKTRLKAVLNEDQAANLATILLKHTLSIATYLSNVDIQLHILGDIDHPCFHPYRHHPAISLHEQQGMNLGNRISHALQAAFFHYQHIVIIGSDCPVITPDYLETAFYQLQKSFDIVVGPAMDGGYILLGLKDFYFKLFQDIPWSTEAVLSVTRQRIKKLGTNWFELPLLFDIDHPDDIKKFAQWYLAHLDEMATLTYPHQYHEIFNSLQTLY